MDHEQDSQRAVRSTGLHSIVRTMMHTLNFFATSALALPRPVKRGVVLALDVWFCIVSVWLAFYLRLGEWVLFGTPVYLAIAVAVVLAIPIFVKSGLYRAIFRYSGLPAMVAVVRSIVLYGIGFSAIFTFWGVDGVPRTVGIIQPILLLLLVGASRAAARVWLGNLYHQKLRRAALPQALIYGAGRAGR